MEWLEQALSPTRWRRSLRVLRQCPLLPCILATQTLDYDGKANKDKVINNGVLCCSYGETVVLSAGTVSGPASLVSKEPGELATIYLNEDLTVIGKLETACDAVISLPTVSRIHAKIRKKEENYFLSDMNSRNGTSVNGRLLRPDEEYQLEPEDEVDFAQARYIFLE